MPSPLAARTACQGIPDSFGPIAPQTCASPPLHRPSRGSPAAPEISDSHSDGSPSRLPAPAHPSPAQLVFLYLQVQPPIVRENSSIPAFASPPQERTLAPCLPLFPQPWSRSPGTLRIRRISRETLQPLAPPLPLRCFPTTSSVAPAPPIPPLISSVVTAPRPPTSK